MAWYDDPRIGLGILVLLGGIGIGSCNYLYNAGQAKFRDTIKAPQIQSADLTGDRKSESFYTLEGKAAVTETAGEPIIDFIKRHSEKDK